MTVRTGRLVVIFILSTLFQDAGSVFYNTSDEAITDVSITRSKFFLDISRLIRQLDKKVPLHLQILYDRKYKDHVADLLTPLSRELNGLTIYEYNNSLATLTTLLKAAKDTTIIATFCSSTDELAMFEMIKKRRLDSHLVTWLLIKERWMKNDFLLSLKSLIFEGTRVLILLQQPDGGLLIMYSRFQSNGVIRFYTHKSSVDENRTTMILSDLVTTRDESIYSDMAGRQVNVSAVNGPTEVVFGRTLPDGSIEPVGGKSFETIRTMGQFLNFTFKVYTPKDRTFGYPQPDGTVTGMIGMVARREAQLAINGIAVNWRRAEVIDYVYPHDQVYMRIFTRSPKPESRIWAIFSLFTSEVWLIIIGCTLVMGPVVYTESRLNINNKSENITKLDLQFTTFNMFRSLVNQGNQLELCYWPQRFIVFSWTVVCLIISALYSGTLTSVLAIPAFEKPIDALTDLPKAVKDGYTLGVARDTTNEYVFKEAKEGIYKQVWGLFNHEDRSKSFLDDAYAGAEKVLSEKMAFMSPSTNFRLLAAKYGSRNFHYGREGFFLQNVGAVIPSGAPYYDAFTRMLLKINEGGLYQKWTDNTFRKLTNTDSDAEEESVIRPFTLGDLQAAFFLILIGYAVALVMFMVEILSFMMHEYNKG